MPFKEIIYPQEKALELDKFKEMDYYAVEKLHLPIELMMENAGLALARIIAQRASKDQSIRVGIGNGNNGGGGLVAARRLLAWGYQVHLDLSTELTKKLPLTQYERALLFGAEVKRLDNPDIWVDAYLGFSQRLPLSDNLIHTIKDVNKSKAYKISLDIPTGFLGDLNKPFFNADSVVTLAAPKKILYLLSPSTEIFVADLGIPESVYKHFHSPTLPFEKDGIIKLKRQKHEY